MEKNSEAIIQMVKDLDGVYKRDEVRAVYNILANKFEVDIATAYNKTFHWRKIEPTQGS